MTLGDMQDALAREEFVNYIIRVCGAEHEDAARKIAVNLSPAYARGAKALICNGVTLAELVSMETKAVACAASDAGYFVLCELGKGNLPKQKVLAVLAMLAPDGTQ